MDRSDLIAAIASDLEARTNWEAKQADLYKARYRGLRRTNLPWPNASDINWPLIDGIIERLKPHYVGQLYATDLLAQFTPGELSDTVSAQMATAAAQWFDYQIKQDTDFETQIVYVVDSQLMLGRPALKVLWDVDKKRLKFRTIQPHHLIVPASTEDLQDADRIVHVIRLSPDAYRRTAGYRNDADFVKRITGRSAPNPNAGDATQRLYKLNREGITHGIQDEIVLWEVWVRQPDGKWTFEVFAPTCPEESVKDQVGNVYSDGLAPFVDFPNELTQPDWYAPRGIGEIVLPFQAQLTKLLNSKNDALTLYNTPLFRSEREGAGTANLRWRPGQILPMGVQPIPMPQPPISWDVQMNMMREVAEGLVATPDFGMARSVDLKKARTATEMEQIASLNQQSSDLRMRAFRRGLGGAYQMAYSRLKQYAADRLRIWFNEQIVDIPKEALSDKYRVKPSGSGDGGTRQALWRKAVSRLQMLNNDPYIDQGELRKSVLESDDPGLVRRLYRDPEVKMASAAEDQAVEIGVMKLGLPAVVTMADDHATHIKTVLMYVQQQNATQQPPTPMEMQLLSQHLAAHVKGLEQSNPQMAKEAAHAIEVIGATIAQSNPQNAEATP